MVGSQHQILELQSLATVLTVTPLVFSAIPCCQPRVQ